MICTDKIDLIFLGSSYTVQALQNMRCRPCELESAEQSAKQVAEQVEEQAVDLVAEQVFE